MGKFDDRDGISNQIKWVICQVFCAQKMNLPNKLRWCFLTFHQLSNRYTSMPFKKKIELIDKSPFLTRIKRVELSWAFTGRTHIWRWDHIWSPIVFNKQGAAQFQSSYEKYGVLTNCRQWENWWAPWENWWSPWNENHPSSNGWKISGHHEKIGD